MLSPCSLSAKLLFALCAVLTLASFAPGQITNVDNTTSTPIPGAGHDYIHLLSETVNPTNGSVSLRIQIPMPKGRGISIPFSFGYDSNGVHHLEPTSNLSFGTAYWAPNSSYLGQGGWTYSVPMASASNWIVKGGNYPTYFDCGTFSNYMFTDSSGGQHALSLGTQFSGGAGTCPGSGFSNSQGGDAAVRATLPNTHPDNYNPNATPAFPVTVYTDNGTVYTFPFPPHFLSGQVYVGFPSSIEDRNGNLISITDNNNGSFVYRDSAGRSVISSNGFGPSGTTNTLSVSGVTYQVTWKTISANFSTPSTWVGPSPGPNGAADQCSPIPQANDTETVVSQIVILPNGKKFQFYYGTDNPDPNFQNPYGLLSEIDYPTGGWVKYTWKLSDTMNELANYPGEHTVACPDSISGCPAPVPDGCQYQYKTPVVASRSVGFGGSSAPALVQTFSYTTAWSSGGTTWTTKSTNLTTTDNVLAKSSLTAYTYQPITASTNNPFGFTSFSGQIPLESQIKYYDWGNTTTPIRTVNKTWQDVYHLASQQTVLDNGQASKTTYTYVAPAPGNFLEPHEVDEYDYGLTSPSRKTITNYQSFTGAPGIIVDAPCQTIVYDGNGNNPVAESDYFYDGSASSTPCSTATNQTLPGTGIYTNHDETLFGTASSVSRGNLTKVVKQCFQGSTACASGNPTTTYTYDETGQVLTTVDPNGNAAGGTPSAHTTSYSYTDNFDSPPSTNTNAYLYKITRPSTNGVAHIESFKYAYSDGQLIQSTDENNQVTSYFYADSLRRLTETDYPDGGKNTLSYNDSPYNPSTPSPSVTTTRAMTSSANVTSLVAFDGLGHAVRSVLTSDPNCASGDRTDTTYDGFGRVYTVSNPYCTTSDTTYGLTTYSYDALGRSSQVTRQDGSIALTSYTGNCTTVTDEAHKVRKNCTDGLGRLIEVDTPTGAPTPPTAGSGTLGVGGGPDQSISVSYVCGPNGQLCYRTVYDSGTITVTVSNFPASATYWQNSTIGTITTDLVNALNASGSPVTASTGSGGITITAKTTGAASNYPVSISVSYDSHDFSYPSYSASGPPTLTGGNDANSGFGPSLAVTLYAYDGLSNLTCAVQKGTDTTAFTTCAAAPATWRPRSFTYNSLSQLTNATNPESGAISYTYDPNGNLATKTAPKPNQTGALTVSTTYSYDQLNRLIQNSFSDGATPTVKYGYDAVSPSGCTLPPTLSIHNGIGKRTGMCDGAGAEAWSWDITPSIGWKLSDARTTNNVTKTTFVQNNLAGMAATLTYPSGRAITYTPNAAARIVSAVDSTGPISYATNAAYTPAGALASFQNNGSLYSTFLYNKRLVPCWMYSTTTSTGAPTSCAQPGVTNGTILDYQYNFAGVSDNGNVNQIANRRDPTRTQNFTYDTLNRIAAAQTQTTGVTIPNPNCWGLTFGYDVWGNMLSSSTTGPAGCGEPLPLNVFASNKNQMTTTAGQQTGYCYDAAGNLLLQATCPTSNPVYTYTYNAENQLTATAGMTYTYDGDGKRVQKSNGKLYWYGMGSDPLNETDAVGNTNNASFNEYIFFNGKRIARRDFSNTVSYYFADHLGTARVVTNAGGTLCYDADFYPFGGERIVIDTCDSAYKFTGKERDSESGLDDFGARYNSSSIGRFMSPDEPFADQHTGDPQSWNLYAYARNNPINYTDADGRSCTKDSNGNFTGDTCDLGTGTGDTPDKIKVTAQSDNSTWGDVKAFVLNAAIGIVSMPDDYFQAITGLRANRQIPEGEGISAALGAFIGPFLIPQIEIEKVVESAAAIGKGGQMSRGAQSIAKKLGRALREGYKSAFHGSPVTTEKAAALVRDIMSNPARVDNLGKYTEIYNAAGQGVRLEKGTNNFVTFVEGSKAKP